MNHSPKTLWSEPSGALASNDESIHASDGFRRFGGPCGLPIGEPTGCAKFRSADPPPSPPSPAAANAAPRFEPGVPPPLLPRPLVVGVVEERWDGGGGSATLSPPAASSSSLGFSVLSPPQPFKPPLALAGGRPSRT